MQQVWAEIDPDTGRVRLVRGENRESPISHSFWASYASIASMFTNGMTYYAVSAYYEGTFPVGKAFRILVQEEG